MANIVYVGTSLDGYIAGPDDSLDWLSFVPIPAGDDLGFADFMQRVDAVVMGRRTFETVVGFGHGWHYPKPGIIVSTTLTSVPEAFAGKVQLTSGSPADIVALAREQGFNDLYVDGGLTVQRFLGDDLIDELIVTEIPVLLGGGSRLFGPLARRLDFELVESRVLLGQLVRKHYRRKRA